MSQRRGDLEVLGSWCFVLIAESINRFSRKESKRMRKKGAGIVLSDSLLDCIVFKAIGSREGAKRKVL